MRALVISGGGSKGAYAGGIATHLLRDLKLHYHIFVGTSTGALLVPLLAANEIERIKKIYTSVKQEDIFNRCPFSIRKTPDGHRVRINHWTVVRQFLRGRKTFGESENLRSLIQTTLTPEIFTQISSLNQYVVITVANLTRNVVEYKYARDCTYEEFCDWVWLSSNMVPFMSLQTRNGNEYADGGFGNLVPVQEAIALGATHIDVIILNPRHTGEKFPPSSNAFGLLVRGFNFMLHQIGQDDIKLALAESRYSNITIKLIHTPEWLTDNSYVFDPDQMQDWWARGYEFAQTLDISADETVRKA